MEKTSFPGTEGQEKSADRFTFSANSKVEGRSCTHSYQKREKKRLQPVEKKRMSRNEKKEGEHETKNNDGYAEGERKFLARRGKRKVCPKKTYYLQSPRKGGNLK